MIGRRLGPYEITAKLGEGGMGEVYRATDSKLRREVAIKVLPPAFTADAERLARFEREAQLLAQLQHPNIASIYGLEESDGTRALVMELVEGPTLAERLERGPLPVEESLAIAVEIARALEEAHEKGIVHRDLKPQNVKASSAGKVKVLDFGLAKAMDPAGDAPASASELARSPTLTMGATLQGVILGTAAYMSPEQAKGMPVDKRADIWAFGVVLHEMLAGGRLFTGDSAGDTLAAVIRAEIDFARLPPATPRRVRDLLRRCLERNPKNRLHDIADARIELEEALVRGGEGLAVADAPPASRWRPSPWTAVAAILAVALGVSLLFRPARPGAVTAAPKTTRLTWNLPAGVLPIPVEEESPLVAISPNGTVLAAVLADGSAKRQIYLRALDSLESKALAGTEGASEPFFSPDGRTLAFFAEGELRKVVIESGKVSKIMDAVDSRGAAWAPDGTLVVVPEIDRGLVSVTDSGGAERTIVKPDPAKGERTFRWPQVLPGGRAAIFTVGTVSSPDFYDDATIDAVDLATGERKQIYEGASFARYSPAAGELVLGRGGSLFAVPFDPERLVVSGKPRLVLDGVGSDVTTGAVHVSVAGDGTLVYLVTEARAAESQLAWLSASGGAEPLGAPPRTYWSWSLSPDGTKLVALIAARERGELWTYDLVRGVFSRLATNERSFDPIWTPDGRHILYSRATATGTEIVRRTADGGEAEVLAPWPGSVAYLRSIPADGSRLFFELGGGPGQVSDIYSMPIVPGAKADRVVSTRDDEYYPMISPDGRWLAYVSQQSGRGEVYLRPLPEAGGRIQVSSRGGSEPRWSADGRTLYYRSANSLSKVDLRFEPRLEASAPRPVEGVRLSPRRSLFTYTVGKDGRFLAIQPGEEAARSEIVVILDWAAELRRSLAAVRAKP